MASGSRNFSSKYTSAVLLEIIIHLNVASSSSIPGCTNMSCSPSNPHLIFVLWFLVSMEILISLLVLSGSQMAQKTPPWAMLILPTSLFGSSKLPQKHTRLQLECCAVPEPGTINLSMNEESGFLRSESQKSIAVIFCGQTRKLPVFIYEIYLPLILSHDTSRWLTTLKAVKL